MEPRRRSDVDDRASALGQHVLDGDPAREHRAVESDAEHLSPAISPSVRTLSHCLEDSRDDL